MVRIFAILAHPKKDSFSGRIFYSVVQYLQNQGAHVDVLDLYDRINDVPFYTSPQTLEQLPFYQENKERFMAADRIFIVYPIYWYAVPGILKCWLDIITNYAWKFESGHHPRPLHKIKKALVVNSASMPNLYRWLFTANSGSAMLKESFKFLGIKDHTFYEIGSTNKLSQAKVDAHIAKIIQKSNALVKNS